MKFADCGTCNKHSHLDDFLIFENSDMIVSHMTIPADKDQVYLGYCFIETKRHLTHCWELTDQQASTQGLWIKKLSLAHYELLSAEKTYFFKFADITPHYHIHVYPRHSSTPETLIGEAVRNWTEAPTGDHKTVSELCNNIRAYFNE